MILDAAWAPAPLAESQLVFATAGRDRQVRIWRRRRQRRRQQQQQQKEGEAGPAEAEAEAEIACVATIPETHPVTAVDFLPRIITTTAGLGGGGGSGGGGGGGRGGQLVLAVGTEAGRISLYGLDAVTLDVSSSLALRPE